MAPAMDMIAATRPTATRIASTIFLTFASSLVAYGLYGLSRFSTYTGEYFDDRLAGFDNGVYPFVWGCLFLVLGQCLRLRGRSQFVGMVALAGILLLSWKRITMPDLGNAAVQLFPDAEILDSLIVVCAALWGLVLADRFVQRFIDFVLVDPVRRLGKRLNAYRRG